MYSYEFLRILASNPSIIKKVSEELPPRDNNGKGTPTTGIMPIVMAILKKKEQNK